MYVKLLRYGFASSYMYILGELCGFRFPNISNSSDYSILCKFFVYVIQFVSASTKFIVLDFSISQLSQWCHSKRKWFSSEWSCGVIITCVSRFDWWAGNNQMRNSNFFNSCVNVHPIRCATKLSELIFKTLSLVWPVWMSACMQ